VDGKRRRPEISGQALAVGNAVLHVRGSASRARRS
jgi:hypothetical protein